jgi:hypothetical protein
MTTTKRERVERLLDELIDNLDNIQYWINQYDFNKPPESDNNSDALYIMTHYAEAVEATFKTIKGLME